MLTYFVTFEEFVFLLGISLKIENKVIQLFYHELVFLKTFVSDVEDGILVCWFVVHVEDDMGLRNRHDIRYISRAGFYSVFSYGDMHIGSVSLELLHGS